jgi:hypothetical protein
MLGMILKREFSHAPLMLHISAERTELYVHIMLTAQNSTSSVDQATLYIMLENEANSCEEFLHFIYHGANVWPGTC